MGNLDNFFRAVINRNILLNFVSLLGKGYLYTLKMKPAPQPEVWKELGRFAYDTYKLASDFGVTKDYSIAGIVSKVLKIPSKYLGVVENLVAAPTELGKGSDITYHVKEYLRQVESEILKRLPHVVAVMNTELKFAVQ